MALMKEIAMEILEAYSARKADIRDLESLRRACVGTIAEPYLLSLTQETWALEVDDYLVLVNFEDLSTLRTLDVAKAKLAAAEVEIGTLIKLFENTNPAGAEAFHDISSELKRNVEFLNNVSALLSGKKDVC